MAVNMDIVPKRLALSKANAQMVIIISVAAFITVFCLVAAKSILGLTSYQSRVIQAQDKAINQLNTNLNNFSSLNRQYNNFVANSTNIIGGQINSSANNGGNNSKIILDALPPGYDFPALVSSIEGILTNQGLDITGISGTDNQLTEQSNTSSPNPTPVSMPFSFTISNVNYQQIGSLLNDLQKSVRPIAIDNISVNGGGNNINLTIEAHTYFQPAKSLGITEQAIK